MTKVLIVNNRDKRMEYIKKILANKCQIIAITDELKFFYELQDEKTKYIILPVRGVDNHQVINDTSIKFTDNYLQSARGKTIYTGLVNDEFLKKCEANNIRLVSYLNENIAIDNNYLTTEGIIEAIVNNSERAIYKSKILIVGYGKLGQIAANILKAMKADITISCRHKKDFLHAKINDYIVINHPQIIGVVDQFDFIINTIPFHILDHLVLQKINESKLLIIDVSSEPYGLDHMFAKDKGINTLLLPGIPGKKAPQTAGEIIGNFIYEDIFGGENNEG